MRVFAPGVEIAGYRIEAFVGRGGMGLVYRAVEIALDRVVALKVIAPELVEDDGVRARFLREARAAAAIEHPHVIPIHAAGERGGIAYLAMRFIDGDDLRAKVRRGGPLSVERALEVVEQAASGLDAIHHAGFVHRDIKPANLLVDPSGHVYVTDFGLAKEVFSHSGQTSTGQWVGTLDYVAPEQIRGGRVDARADVYALGGVLHFALTAHVPFERQGDEAKLWAQLSEPPPKASRWRPEIPPALDAVVTRAMAKDAEARFPSAGDLGRAARAALRGTAPAVPERMVARGAAAPGGAVTEAGLAPEASTVTALRRTVILPVRRRARWALPAAALGVVLAGVLAMALLSDDPPARQENGARGSPRSATPQLTIAQTIPDVGHRPNALVHAGGDLWVTGGSHDRLTRIDPATGRVLGRGTKIGRRPSSMVEHDGTIWVALTVDRRLVGVDAESGRVSHRIDLGARGLQVDADDSGTWVLADMPGRKYLLLHHSPGGRLLDRIDLEHSASAIALGGGAVWLANQRGPVITRIDPRTHRQSDLVAVPGRISSLSYDGGYLWAVLPRDDMVIRIDPRTGGKAQLAAGHEPGRALLVGRQLVVSSSNDQRVLLFDARSFRLLDDVVVGLNPFAMDNDGRSVWVARLGDDTLTRIEVR